jgi:hypothetical protein
VNSSAGWHLPRQDSLEDRRERVLSVLEALDARAHDAKTDEALGEAARLVRNAARELWAKPN